MKSTKTISLIFVLLCYNVYGQGNFCGHDSVELAIRQRDSVRYDAFNRNFRNSVQYFRKKSTGVFSLPNRPSNYSCEICLTTGTSCPKTRYVIPVVVHVVYTNGANNISDSQIYSQIEALNNHFSNKASTASPAVNTGIQFILATKDANGTTISGITRHNSPLSNHRKISESDSLMRLGIANLPMDKYLHIWVVNQILDTAGNNVGVKAYSTKPGSYFSGSEGMVCSYDWFGDYSTFSSSTLNASSTGSFLTHEVGHYLGLLHPFDKGGCTGLNNYDCHLLGDMCCDVPAVAYQNPNCGTYNTCTESYYNDPFDQKQNYMDYSPPTCVNTFTADQTSIMQITLNTFRQGLWQSTHINAMFSSHCVLSSKFTRNKNFTCYDLFVMENATFSAYNQSGATYTWRVWRNDTLTGISSSTYTLNISNSTPGKYKVALIVSNSSETICDTMENALVVFNCGDKLHSDRANWYFGTYAGLGFYEGNFVAKDLGPYLEISNSNPNIEVEEGSLALSDSATGDLLFYGAALYGTKKLEIYGKNYTLLKGVYAYTTGLVGFSDAMQAGVAFKAPGFAHEYILFSTGGGRTQNHLATGYEQSGIVYSFIRIDTADRTNDSVTFRKNLNIRDSTGQLIDGQEGIAAVRHCNGRDYWVLCKGNLDTIYRLLVTTGRSVIYKGFFKGGEITSQNMIVFSPNGKFFTLGRYLFSFNRSTGAINLLHFDSKLNAEDQSDGVYGAAFSPKSKILYRSYLQLTVSGPNFTPIYQYDLESSDSFLGRKDINADFWDIRSLQNTPDGRIFLSATGMPFVSELATANNLNFGSTNNCGYKEIAVNVSEKGIGGYSGIDLPNFPISGIADEDPLDFMVVIDSCKSIRLTSNRTCSQNHKWLFGDGDTSLNEEPTHTYDLNGTYEVTLIVGTDSLTRTVSVELPKSQYRIMGDTASCNLNQLFEYQTKPGPAMTYTWSCTNCSSSTANQHLFETKFNGNSKVRLTIKDDKTKCQFKDSIDFEFINAIGNNVITLDNDCLTPQLIGSTPTGGSGTFEYRWVMQGENMGMEVLSGEKNKDLTPAKTLNNTRYFRMVQSGNCATNSNVITMADLNLNNRIFKSVSGSDTCASILLGTDIKKIFPDAVIQWQVSTNQSSWTDIPGASDKDFNQFINDTIVRYFRRMVTDSICESFSDTIENRMVKISRQPVQQHNCYSSFFPVRYKYAFESPNSLRPITIVWQHKKPGSSDWSSFIVLTSTDTMTSLQETFTNTLNQTDTLKLGDTVRFRYFYNCGNSYNFYSASVVLKTTDTLRIISQPQNKNITAGNPVMFRAVVNEPEYCTYQWQYSRNGINNWKDMPNSNDDTLDIPYTGGCYDSLYYRVRISHPCHIKYSSNALLKTDTSSPSFDYWMKDMNADVGLEPHDSLNIVRSPDIWVRHKNDGIKVHQEPAYNLKTNWVNATVRNRGQFPTNTAKLYLYWTWASTGETWDRAWTHNPNNIVNGKYMGGQINKFGIVIDTTMNYGDTVNISVPWTEIPQLDWYDLSKTWYQHKINVCFLARIQTCPEAPFGMTHTETTDVKYNVRYNNNIATKNAWVVYLIPEWDTDNTGGQGGSQTKRSARPSTGNDSDNLVSGGIVKVTNTTDESTTIKLCVKLRQAAYLAKANTYIEMSDALHTAWVSGGSYSSGLVHVVGKVYRLTSTDACIWGITAVSGFDEPVSYYFSYKDKANRLDKAQVYEFEVTQYDESDEITGQGWFEVWDNLFIPPTVIESEENLTACDWDMSGGVATYSVPYPQLPYTIYDQTTEDYIENNESETYSLTQGEYFVKITDEDYNRIYEITINVYSSNPTPVNSVDTVWYDCDYLDSVDYVKTCENGVMYDMFDQVVSESSPGHYTLDPQEPWYTFVCADSTNCIRYNTQLTFMDIIQIPVSTSNYLTGMYNREEHPCCFIDLTEAECDGETPLTFGQEIQVYDMNADFLYQTNLELYGGTVLGFRFCPPQWDTSSNVISNWYSIVIRNDECSFCRMDFMCDSVGDPEPFVILNYPSGKLTGGVSQNNGKANTNGAVQGGENKSTGGKLPMSVSVHPIPATSEVNVKVFSVNSPNLTVQISDAAGKPVYSGSFETSNGNLAIKVNLADFASGVYTVYIPELNYFCKLVIIK